VEIHNALLSISNLIWIYFTQLSLLRCQIYQVLQNPNAATILHQAVSSNIQTMCIMILIRGGTYWAGALALSPICSAVIAQPQELLTIAIFQIPLVLQLDWVQVCRVQLKLCLLNPSFSCSIHGITDRSVNSGSPETSLVTTKNFHPWYWYELQKLSLLNTCKTHLKLHPCQSRATSFPYPPVVPLYHIQLEYIFPYILLALSSPSSVITVFKWDLCPANQESIVDKKIHVAYQ
jgi:hypothetical protein